MSSDSTMQDDVSLLLRTLGMPDTARPYSTHVVLTREIIPAVKRLMGALDYFISHAEAEGFTWDDYLRQLQEHGWVVDTHQAIQWLRDARDVMRSSGAVSHVMQEMAAEREKEE